MPLETRYVFIASMDVDPEVEALFNEVYDQEHVPELLKVPGVVSVTRCRKVAAELSIGGDLIPVGDPEPAYIAIYELENPDVLKSEAWSAAVDKGRWAGEVRPYTRNRHHVMHRVAVTSP